MPICRASSHCIFIHFVFQILWLPYAEAEQVVVTVLQMHVFSPGGDKFPRAALIKCFGVCCCMD